MNSIPSKKNADDVSANANFIINMTLSALKIRVVACFSEEQIK